MSDLSTPARTGRKRRALGPGLTVFLIIDVLLVAAFVVLAVNAPQRGGPQAPPVASTSVEPETTPDASAPSEVEGAEAIEAFALPSGNIWCTMSADTATCTILEFSYERPAAPDDCEGEVGQVVRVTAEAKTGFPCVEDAVEMPADLPVLDYGEASTVGEMTCQASERGAFCRHDPSQAGFSIARAGVNRF